MRQDFTVCVQAWLVGVVLSVIVSERDDDADDDRCNSIRTVER